MGVDMRGIEQDPLMVQPQPQIRYPTSPSSPDQPNLLKELAIDKGAEIGMQMATDALVGGTAKMIGTSAAGPVGGVAATGIYEGALKPLFKKLFFNNGGMVGGPLSPMMTNVSKVRYKQHGGKVSEEIELNYHGPLASKGG
jgi:hypothetical protein